jgi:hypothetical protein
MFVVTEAQAATIRTAYEQRGEFYAAVELRQLFPGITDNAQARECVRMIASWRRFSCCATRGLGGWQYCCPPRRLRG